MPPTDDELHTNVKGILPGQPPAAWEWRESAFRMIRQTCEKIDADRRRVFQPRLAEVPLSRGEWASKVKATLTVPPHDVDAFVAAAAECVAAVESLLRAEDGNPFLGDAA